MRETTEGGFNVGDVVRSKQWPNVIRQIVKVRKYDYDWIYPADPERRVFRSGNSNDEIMWGFSRVSDDELDLVLGWDRQRWREAAEEAALRAEIGA